MKYTVVFEKTPNHYSAYVPGLPGCVATGTTPAEVNRHIREAMTFHLEGLWEEKLPIPEPLAWETRWRRRFIRHEMSNPETTEVSG
jgi:predicted RNase H-like HicB family nuclease